MKILINLFIYLLLSSCATSSHVTRPTIPQYAPKDYKAKGVVKYLNNGADFVIEKRREDAFKQMYDACGGNYKITSESDREESKTISQGLGNTWNVGGYNYWYISYECTDVKN
jgi:hypothetical protein